MLDIDPQTRHAIRNSFGSVLADRVELSRRFYEGLFASHPELRAMFPEDLTELRRKFVDMIVVVIDSAIGPATRLLEEAGARHAGYGVLPEHYPVAREALLTALRESHPAGDPELERAWAALLDAVIAAMLRGAQSSLPRAPVDRTLGRMD